MSALDQLYQQVILDHARERHGFGLREAAAGQACAESHQYNPVCGDDLTVRVIVAMTPDGHVVRDVAWDGVGCSISQASTSVLHDLVVDCGVPQAREVVEQFRTMIRSRGSVVPDEEVLGDAAAFAGVGRHVQRVKCAMLGWTAFEDALYRAVPGLFDAASTAAPTTKESR
jgi:nitrogen fixation NifU-like protein